MSALPIALVATSGFVHALWNLWAKRSAHPLVFLWSFQAVAVVLYLPFALSALQAHPISSRGWLWLALSLAAHGVYVLLLARSYRMADLSQLYPMMRGVSPLLVPLLGVTLLGEHLSPAGWGGALLIVLGVMIVGGGLPTGRSGAAAYFGLAVGLGIASYTLLDKVTLGYVPAIALNVISNAGNLVALTIPALRTGQAFASWRSETAGVLAAGVLSPLSYLLFLWALTQGPVAVLAPMRELGIVFGTVLGVFVLRERRGGMRLLGALIIVLGAVALAVGA